MYRWCPKSKEKVRGVSYPSCSFFLLSDPGSSWLWHPPALSPSWPTPKCPPLATPVGTTAETRKPEIESGRGVDGQGWEGVSYLLQLQPQFPRPETLKLGLPPGLASGESHPWLPAARDLPPSKELMLLSLGFIIPASTRQPRSPQKAVSLRTCSPDRLKRTEQERATPFPWTFSRTKKRAVTFVKLKPWFGWFDLVCSCFGFLFLFGNKQAILLSAL